jgi:hypothetical protein
MPLNEIEKFELHDDERRIALYRIAIKRIAELEDEIRAHAKWAEQFWKNPDAKQAQELVLQLGQVWAVVYSNYSPTEVDSLWRTSEKAEARAEDLGGFQWHVEQWDVG